MKMKIWNMLRLKNNVLEKEEKQEKYLPMNPYFNGFTKGESLQHTPKAVENGRAEQGMLTQA